MPSRRTVLGGCAGLLSTLAGCSLLPPPPGEEPHPTRDWLYDPSQFPDQWRRYRVVDQTPALWVDHRQWLGDDTVRRALDAQRRYYDAFGVEAREVDWRLSVGDPDATLPQLRVSAAAFNRQSLEHGVNTTSDERLGDYHTMATYRAPDRDRAFAAGGDYLVDCRYEDASDVSETLRTCIDTQMGAVDRFTATSENCRRLADALADDAEFTFDVLAVPESGVVGRGWQRLFDEETTYLKAAVLFDDAGRADEAAVGQAVSLPEWRSNRKRSVSVDDRLGVVTATRPTETVRLDTDPFDFA